MSSPSAPTPPPSAPADAARGAQRTLGITLADRYRLQRPLGFGATARVFLAFDTHLEREVAVKVLHPDLMAQPEVRRRFRSEAQSAAKLRHPHVVAVYDWSDAETEPFLVTEYLPGGSLRALLDENGPLSLSQTLAIGLDAANGLAAAHHEGIVHRDIKPANLLFALQPSQFPTERLCIADFGIARIMAEASWTEPGGLLVGTARYAAPEQATGRDVGPPADVYALALTMIEAATGSVPAIAATPLATMMRRQDDDIDVPSSLGPLRPILAAATHADPALRPTAAELASALARTASALPRPAPLPLVVDATSATPVSPAPVPTSEAVRTSEARSDHAHDPVEIRREIATDVDPTAVLELDDPTFGEAMLEGDRFADDRAASAGPRIEDFGPVEFGDDHDDDYDDEFDEARSSRSGLLLVGALVALIAVGVLAIVASQRDAEPVIETFPAGTYVGRMVDEVETELSLRDWTATIAYERQDDTEVGEVLQQVPAPGTELEAGAGFTLVVSEGPLLHPVPNLVGLTKADALSTLASSGLAVGLIDSSVNDEEVPPGSVVSQAVAPGSELETGATVDLAISAGPATRIVPAVAGMTLEEATAVLAELGLVVVAGEDYSQTVPEGQVIGTDPGADATVARDSEIAVTVSLGLPFVTVPDVTDMDPTEADRVLTEAGLDVVDIVGPLSTVITTDPEPGQSVRQGTEIRIFTRSRS